MTTDTIESPPAAAPITALATITAAALEPLNRIEGDLRALAERYRSVAFDLATPKGLAEAKAARLDLRENGRYAVQRATDTFKKQANDAKRAVELKAEQLIAITKPREDEIDGQIKAREEQIEAEREAKRQAEADRIARHEKGLAGIGAFLVMAQKPDMTAERINVGIAALEAVQLVADEWQEFYDRAVALREQTLAGMREQRDRLAAREAEAARLEAQRLENERVAAENARIAAELKRQADELAAAKAESERLERLALEKRAALQNAQAHSDGAQPAKAATEIHETAAAPGVDQGLDESMTRPEEVGGQVDGCRAPESQPDVCSGHVSQDQTSLPASPSTEAPTLKLGDINTRLGFTMTRDFIEQSLGIIPAGTDKRAVLFRSSQFAAICDALVIHIRGAAAQE